MTELENKDKKLLPSIFDIGLFDRPSITQPLTQQQESRSRPSTATERP